jgi:hypothetical protein
MLSPAKGCSAAGDAFGKVEPLARIFKQGFGTASLRRTLDRRFGDLRNSQVNFRRLQLQFAGLHRRVRASAGKADHRTHASTGCRCRRGGLSSAKTAAAHIRNDQAVQRRSSWARCSAVGMELPSLEMAPIQSSYSTLQALVGALSVNSCRLPVVAIACVMSVVPIVGIGSNLCQWRLCIHRV